jgi:hypothetical protein
MRKLLRRGVPLIALGLGIAASAQPASANDKCKKYYVLMNGECPELCPYGDLCPCTICPIIIVE